MVWLEKEENRMACFGGAGAKCNYGAKSVVKPGTAYNALAQGINSKFGTSWDSSSAKSRVRNMKRKFTAVFIACNGKCDEESEKWKLTDEDKARNIFTLADKAQYECPYWNLWLKWCGNDPNLSRHGFSDSLLDVDDTCDEQGSDSCDEYEVNEEADEGAVSFSEFAAIRDSVGDSGHAPSDSEGEDAPRPASARVEQAPSDPRHQDDLLTQAKKRREALSKLSESEKKKLKADDAKAKRELEKAQSTARRASVAGSSVSSPTSGTPTAVASALFQGSPKDKNFEAQFLADRARQMDEKSDKAAAAQVEVARMQLQFQDKQAAQFQQLETSKLQMQQLQFQMQMQMRQQEMWFNSMVSLSKSKSDFFVAGIGAKVPLTDLHAAASAYFPDLPAPNGFHLPQYPN
jgi:hypothetical protein